MIIHISKFRLRIFMGMFILLLALWFSIGTFVGQYLENSPEGKVVVVFKFHAPMRETSPQDLVIERVLDGTIVPFNYNWLTAST
ncbi:hypothetical protein N752_02515 [Desulforamulus aquiferis]|nr:hypothetical protein [Desulforamulus aquiferis]RYD06559.1 hypothetical protein N752_02515 [Desulforamulus aquiferis]